MIHTDQHILLGMKKRGFGEGRWNGFGGKVQAGESIEEAMLREAQEEAKVIPIRHQKQAIIEFHNEGDEEIIEVHVFRAHEFEGEPVEGEEMRPEWFTHEDIPYDSMWIDDQYWIPWLLQGKKFRARFMFRNFKELLEQSLEEVEHLD